MSRIGVEDVSDTIDKEIQNDLPEDKEWIHALATDDEETLRRIIEKISGDAPQSTLLNKCLDLRPKRKGIQGPKRQITTTTYSPDTPWSLAAMLNSRKAMNILMEYGADCLQITSHGNNMLHVLVAFASTGGDDGEELAISTTGYIKDLIGDDLYCQLLRAENNDGLRPLELASHLGTFGLFMYFFETPGIYITREEDHILYKLQFFDITEYVTGPRYLRSPLFGFNLVEEDKLSSKYISDAYLKDPICNWISVIKKVNIPYIIMWCVIRILYIVVFLACDPVFDDICDYTGGCPDTTILGVNANLAMYIVATVMSVFMVGGDIFDFIHWLYQEPRWRYRHVYGPKSISMHHVFYRLSQYSVALIIAVSCVVTLACHFTNRSPYPAMDIAVIFAVLCFVWSMLYFVQLVPVFGNYVIGVQRMLKDFINFAFLLIIFFFNYGIAFFKLLRTNENMKDFNKMPQSFYSTFRAMLNMVEFFNPDGEVGFAVYIVHVCFVFMVAILLVNFLIATMSSSYEHVMTHRYVLYKMHCLSVSLTVDQRFQRILIPFRNYLRRRLFVYDNDHYYVTRTVNLAVNNPDCTESVHLSNTEA